MLNTFVIHTVDFLNKFATAAEDVSNYICMLTFVCGTVISFGMCSNND